MHSPRALDYDCASPLDSLRHECASTVTYLFVLFLRIVSAEFLRRTDSILHHLVTLFPPRIAAVQHKEYAQNPHEKWTL